MNNRFKALGIGAVLLAAGAPVGAGAQEAVESAVLNSGPAQAEASGARALGSSISRSLRAAGNLLGSRLDMGNASTTRGAASQDAHYSYTIPANIDPLAGTDAPAYRIKGSGALLRVSSGLRPTPDAVCMANCSGN